MRVVVVCGKFTPHHLARFAAAERTAGDHGHELICVAIAGLQSDYQWPMAANRPDASHLHTLFPASDYWQVGYRSVRAALGRMLDRLMPQVVVLPGWGFKESLAGLRWCLRNGVGRVVVSDSQAIDTAPSRSRKLVKSVLVKRFHAALVGGTPHTRYLTELGFAADDCYSGCDVVDNELFATARNATGRSDCSTIRMLSCVRLLPRKNLLSVLEALAERPQWHWTIAGDGPQRTVLERRIHQLTLTNRVTLLGHVDYFSLPKVFGEAQIYLQPSLSEPWGLAVNEAMAAGLPVLVSNRCGCREDLVAQQVNGFVFDPTSAATIGAALDRAMIERERWPAMGEASRKIVGQWNVDRFARSLWHACARAHERNFAQAPKRMVERALAIGL